MKVQHIVLSTVLILISFSSIAQVAIDPTGKRFVKQRERTKFGGPTHNTHKMPTGPESINITFLEIQLDPAAKGDGIDVSARGTKTPKVRGCDNCTVAGRIIINGTATKEIESVGTDSLTKSKQARNPGSCREVSFRNDLNKAYTVVTNPEGGFMLSTLPNGTYSVWVGGKKVITDFILVSVEPSPEELVKEKEMQEKRKALMENKQQGTPIESQDH